MGGTFGILGYMIFLKVCQAVLSATAFWAKHLPPFVQTGWRK